MANYDALIAPFNLVATLLSQKSYMLVPFEQGAVSSQIGSGKGFPSLDKLTVPGLTGVLAVIPGTGGVLDDLEDVLKNIATLNFPGLIENLVKLVPDVAKFVGQQLWVGLSVLAIGNAVSGDAGIVKAITTAYQKYFFDDKGYTTLEGGTISPPNFDSGADSSLADIRNEIRKFASHKTAEQYVRDLIRITVEAGGNEIFQLAGPDGEKERYAALQALTAPGDLNAKKKQSWFKGFSSLAESTVTSAVEEAAQGVSSFASSPLIAASLGTFAGTAARKATQDAILMEFGL